MISVLHNNSLVLRVRMSQVRKQAVQDWSCSALSPRPLPGGWEALNSMLHVLPFDCIVGTVKSLKGQHKSPDLAALYSGHIFFLQHLTTSNKCEN